MPISLPSRAVSRLSFLVLLLTFWFATPAVAQDAQVQIIHNSPDPAAATVDIYIEDSGDNPVDDIQDVDFRTATGFIPLPAGDYNLYVAPGNSNNSGDAVAGPVAVTLAAGTNYTVVANGVLDPNDFDAGSSGNTIDFALDVAAGARPAVDTPDGDVEIRAVHGSPDAPTVDIRANSGPFVDDASYGDITGYLGAPATQVTLDVTPFNGTGALVSFDVDLTPLADEPLTVLASGFFDPDSQSPDVVAPFTLIAVTVSGDVIDLGAARAQIIHNAPDPAAATVDIYVDGALLPALDDFSFRSATPFIDLDSGARSIAVAPGTSTSVGDAIATFDLEVAANASLVIIASGVLDDTNFEANPDGEDIDFELLVETDIRETPNTTGNAEFIIVHGSPDAPTVDARVPSGPTLADDESYTEITDYISVATGTYPVRVTNDLGNVTFATFTAPLTTSATAIVLASGFLTPYNDPAGGTETEPAFGLLAVFADGNAVLLPVEGPLVINEFLADPTVSGGGVDANGDGDISSDDDFVEILNISSSPVDVSGFQIDDIQAGGSTPYTFPAGTTLQPGEAATIFSGGTPTGIPGFSDIGLPALNNGGDDIILLDDSGTVLQRLTYPAPSVPEADGISTARNVNGTGGFVLQTDFGVMADASPGLNNDNGGALPVELSAFTATLDGADVLLAWTTLSETANDRFEIQQRAGDASFRTIGSVRGQGTTVEATDYRFRVKDLTPGTYQFRLRQVDVDGGDSFSGVRTATIGLAERYTLSPVAPHPVSSASTATLQVQGADVVTAELYDLLGRRVQVVYDGPVKPASPLLLTVDGEQLPSGVYFLRVRGEQFETTQRISIVR